MMRQCFLTILRYLRYCSILEPLHRIFFPTKRLSMPSSLSYTLFDQKPTAMRTLFSGLLHPPLKQGFIAVFLSCFCCHFYCCFVNSMTLCGHSYHTLNKLPILLFHLLYRAFNARTFSSGQFCSFFLIQICLPEPMYLFPQIF